MFRGVSGPMVRSANWWSDELRVRKQANISPVFKAGDRSLVTNYRPVALTSIVSKLMESFISRAICNHMESNCLSSQVQHGFVSNTSCVTQLLTITHQWMSILDQRRPPRIDAVFFRLFKSLRPHASRCSIAQIVFII